MGHPWAGVWSADIAAVTEALAAQYPTQHIGVFGTGQFAKPVLFSAALCSRIAAFGVRLEEPTYRDEIWTTKLSEVPRILAVTDLPVVVGLSAPRPCRIEFPPALGEHFRQAYEWTNKFYRSAFDTSGPQLQPAAAPDWNALALWFARNLR
jgi:hypothetical protein